MNKPSNDFQRFTTTSNIELDKLKKICQKTLVSFSAAWRAGDVDGLLGLMSDDPIYIGSTGPNPGTRFSGKEDIRTAFKRMVGSNASSAQEKEEVPAPPQMYFFDDNRAVVFWRLPFPNPEGGTSEVDGVDIMTFTDDGRIAIKDAYRKAFS